MCRRPLLLLVACAALLPACGDDDGESAPPRAANQDAPCPAGTPELGVRDVLPKPPAGMALLRVPKREADQAADGFAVGFGDKMRSLRLAVVAPRGRQVGTGVGVLNLTVSVEDDSPPETSETRQPLEIAGRQGILGVAPGDTGARASGSVGDCALVVIRGADEASVRRVAAAIRQPE